jgi:hypothetical protein
MEKKKSLVNISMEENKIHIVNTNIEKAKIFLTSSPDQKVREFKHEDYVKKYNQKYNLENADLNTSTKVLLFKLTEEDEYGNYIGKKDLKGIDSLGSEQYYTQINACYATTIEQIKLFEDMRHYYFTLMDKSIINDNFNFQMEDDEDDEDNEINIRNFKNQIEDEEKELKLKEEELIKYRQSKLNINNNNNDDEDKLKDDLS